MWHGSSIQCGSNATSCDAHLSSKVMSGMGTVKYQKNTASHYRRSAAEGREGLAGGGREGGKE